MKENTMKRWMRKNKYRNPWYWYYRLKWKVFHRV